MASVLVTGYRASDLGIHNDKDIRVKIIKTAIKRDLLHFLEEGVDWLVFTGNLGFEFWVLEVAKKLQKDYLFQMATIFPFENHGERWNEANQLKLVAFKQVDFTKYAFPRYENPSQFREYNQFLIDNTDAAYLFYDEANETNLKYFYDLASKQENYPIKRLHFDDLNEIVETFYEN